MEKQPKRPKDLNQRAKFILDLVTGEREESNVNGHESPKIAGARLGGLKGGKARAERLTPEEKREIALKAAKKRWNK